MGQPPLVSVIVPAYQAAFYITEALDSVLAQTVQDFEIIVVNDGSPDTAALEAALAPYRSRIVYLKQENQGPAAARNAAIAGGTDTKYIALLDADDRWEPDYLRVQTSVMEADPTIDVLYCDAFLFGPGAAKFPTFMNECPSHGEVTFEALINQTCNVMVSVLARRQAIVQAGGFDPAFCGNEDFDLWLRIIKQGGRIAYHRRPLVHYRRHASSLSASRLRMCAGLLDVLRKLLQRSDLSAEERTLVLNRMEYVRAVIGWEEGMTAVLKGNSAEAAEKLAYANRVLRRPRLNLLIGALRTIPWIAIPACRLRQRISGAR